MLRRVELVGGRELSRSLANVARDLDDLSGANRDAGDLLASVARVRAPRRSGTLAASTTPHVFAGGVSVFSPVRYFWPVHSGTSRTPAQPYVAEAIRDSEDRILRIYDDEVEQVLARVRGV